MMSVHDDDAGLTANGAMRVVWWARSTFKLLPVWETGEDPGDWDTMKYKNEIQ